jgi:hypothetical protein
MNDKTKIDALAVIDQAALHFEREREDAERAGQPGTATVYDAAAREFHAARAAVAELIAAVRPFDDLLESPDELNEPILLQVDPADVARLRAALARIES